MNQSIDLRLDGDGAFADFRGRPSEHKTTFLMTGLRDGMTSGRPLLMFAVELADGKVVYIETSLRLMETSINALKARWGMPTTPPGAQA